MAAADLSNKYQKFLQMLWDPEPKNDEPGNPPLYCLGQQYVSKQEEESSAPKEQAALSNDQRGENSKVSFDVQTHTEQHSWPLAFLENFESLFSFTYRNDFPQIPRVNDQGASGSLTLAVRLRNLTDASGFSSDTGWGCMIRSGQCLLGNALRTLRLGRGWRRGDLSADERSLIAMFADDPRAPFSIHNFVAHGAAECGKHPGEWFGPSATAHCIESLSNAHAPTGLCVYVAGEGAQIYEGSIQDLAQRPGQGFSPILVLAALRLGIDRVTPVYRDALKELFHFDHFVGIAGGRPSASHYFVAVQGDNFFYLDPHHTRPALPYHTEVEQYTSSDIDSVHTRRLRRLHIDKMDPSMLLAFLLKSEEDLERWKSDIKSLPGIPFLSIAQGRPPGTSLERETAVDEVEAFDDDMEDTNDEE